MEIKVYADVLFFTNLFMDFIILYISTKLLKCKPYILKITASAVLGAIYSTVIFFVPCKNFLSVSLKMVVGLLMVYIGFKPKRITLFIKQICVFFSVSLCLGGAGFCLLYFTNAGAFFGAVFSSGTVYVNFPIYKLILSCGICYAVLNIATSVIKAGKRRSGTIFDVVILRNERKAELKALCDSGNILREAKTDKGVLIVTWDAVKSLFDTTQTFYDFVEENRKIFVPIPYKSVSGRSIMLGFVPDSAKANGVEMDVYAAISETNLGDYYDGILPGDFEEGVEKND